MMKLDLINHILNNCCVLDNIATNALLKNILENKWFKINSANMYIYIM